ncbi:cyclopropane fatty acyl phospholipid synthase [Devosia limi DSM 17137]|uniref:Cyclopropane-fatty-acyl-phospholipid synthase n=1 Tax=Devosia limi DSM 17137 TaxID=1121477 RepID=A0A0F5L1W4_9HYPH|nr:cyclopropane fatty acyl phospholipid synthase [Devosia limi]KKB76185.1 cyclopropane fatty acyl phospholipid synthase [Devosia limi DSM 17137]SHF19978.1 cyclopropane-fatty-acyl-phospholipid synthase [Devosia limi DSM 17137]
MSSTARNFIETQLQRADVAIGGSRSWDLQVHNEALYGRVLSQGTLGLGESYMDGWWDAEALDLFLFKLINASIQDQFPRDLALIGSVLRSKLLNLQRLHVREVGERHYDIGNDLYAAMLDKRMIYSCGYWKDATTLDAAQEAKLDLICRKVGLQPGMRILDIGSGWGGFLQFAAERYGVSGVGITISKEQAALANARTAGLPVETRLMDYLELDGQFDRIISIGMFEHVGYKNYHAYFAKARALLVEDGLMLLHTIGGNQTTTHGDPWSEKYIFPNGMLPSIAQIGTATEKLFVMEDWHNFGADYDRTLMAWHANFVAAWPQLEASYGPRFYRMWRYYLNVFAALFRARHIGLWQVVLSPKGVPGGYASIR